MSEMHTISCPSCDTDNQPRAAVDGIQEYRCRVCGMVYYGPCGCDHRRRRRRRRRARERDAPRGASRWAPALCAVAGDWETTTPAVDAHDRAAIAGAPRLLNLARWRLPPAARERQPRAAPRPPRRSRRRARAEPPRGRRHRLGERRLSATSTAKTWMSLVAGRRMPSGGPARARWRSSRRGCCVRCSVSRRASRSKRYQCAGHASARS